MQSGDGLVIVLIIAALALWSYVSVRSRMRHTIEDADAVTGDRDWLDGLTIPEDETTDLLEQRGYTILGGKKRIPVLISHNRKDTLQSRLFLDYIVEKDGELYAVKLAKERSPLEMSGSIIRERLLIYQLLLPGAAGVLYVDTPSGRVDRFEFELQFDKSMD
ncbi:hypothetical protein O9H85_10485 [Paenibacillus filicis]|uniref:DUF4860 domain-containing protein n=1 Tax=Paenibacillus gyeongsangnamensis TaxID=3388067 RepID=A0ABT4Q7N1_9BACL|nr:hypothetical protein [Paenibacillus filicis]MCZ8512834.1 hypothetical protein [Paenibacillus filicis]